MPVADMLVDVISSNRIVSFLDRNAGYNQIFMVEADIPKTAFRCPGAIGLFEWVKERRRHIPARHELDLP